MGPIENVKKYCQYCNCWMANNKISIQNHENGNKHKLSVQRKITSMRRHNVELEKDKKTLSSTLKKIESDAQASLAKAITKDPSLAKKAGANFYQPKFLKRDLNPEVAAAMSSNSGINGLTATQFRWKELKANDGSIYYWNRKTGETTWSKPVGEFIEPLDTGNVDFSSEKDKLNQFLLSKLVKLSEEGMEAASEAVCGAFNAPHPPVFGADFSVPKPDEDDDEPLPVMEEFPEGEKEEDIIEPITSYSSFGKKRKKGVSNPAYGPWTTVEAKEEPKVPEKPVEIKKPELVAQLPGSKINFQFRPTNTAMKLLKTTTDEAEKELEKLERLNEAHQDSYYSENTIKMGTKTIKPGSLHNGNFDQDTKLEDVLSKHLYATNQKEEEQEREIDDSEIIFKKRCRKSKMRSNN